MRHAERLFQMLEDVQMARHPYTHEVRAHKDMTAQEALEFVVCLPNVTIHQIDNSPRGRVEGEGPKEFQTRMKLKDQAGKALRYLAGREKKIDGQTIETLELYGARKEDS